MNQFSLSAEYPTDNRWNHGFAMRKGQSLLCCPRSRLEGRLWHNHNVFPVALAPRSIPGTAYILWSVDTAVLACTLEWGLSLGPTHSPPCCTHVCGWRGMYLLCTGYVSPSTDTHSMGSIHRAIRGWLISLYFPAWQHQQGCNLAQYATQSEWPSLFSITALSVV